MSPLRKAVADYLELRRGLGFKLDRDAKRLGQFISFMERRKATRITTRLAVEFATHQPHLCARTMAMHLGVVRGFARYQLANDPATEVPPPRLLAAPSRPAMPYLYSEEEIIRLLRAARDYPSWSRFPGPLWHRCRGWTWYCFFGFLAVTGMRMGEVRNLCLEDIDWQAGVLTIRKAKFGKSRLVPLHDTMLQALRTFIKHRDRFFTRFQPHIVPQRLFVNSRGKPIAKSEVNRRFMLISRQIGLRGAHDRRGPRLHDFRHRFAIETLLRWYRSGEDVERLLPVLSTYLGHTHVSSTYWYLRCTPELMAAARDRLERRWKGAR
jgi:integrase